LKTHPHSFYQWSTIGRNNELINAQSRDLVVNSNDLVLNGKNELYIALVDNSAIMEQSIKQGEQIMNEGFSSQRYNLSMSFQAIDDKSLCLNACSNNGVCKNDSIKSKFPYCVCFEDYVGADCNLVAKQIEIEEP